MSLEADIKVENLVDLEHLLCTPCILHFLTFMFQNGSLFYWHLYENMQQANNRVDNFESVYCTLALICVEMGGDDILIELFRLALGIQVKRAVLHLLYMIY